MVFLFFFSTAAVRTQVCPVCLAGVRILEYILFCVRVFFFINSPSQPALRGMINRADGVGVFEKKKKTLS